MKFLVKVKSPVQEKSIKFLLHEHLGGPQPERGMAKVHASELTKPEGICARAYALADLTHPKAGVRWLSTSENMTYELGRQVQDMVVNAMAEMDKAVCDWKCVSCSYLHKFQKRPIKCESCNARKFDPVECRFESAVSGASCGVDMLVALGDPKLLPVEIKTMAPDQFKTLAAPLAEHKLRTNFYLRILAESGDPNAQKVRTDRAAIFYVSKGAYGCASPDLKAWGLKESFSPFKEFWVDRDDKQTDCLVEAAKPVKLYRDKQIGIPAGVCPTAMTKRACGCPVKTACWSGDYPAGAEIWP
jgi:hypothetical protein